jgi:hypothetical protein
MKTLKISEENVISELIDDEGSFIEGDYLSSDKLTVTNKPDRNGVPPPTSYSHSKETGQDPSSKLHYFGFSAMSEAEIKEDVVQDKRSDNSSVVNKNSEILSLKDIEELFNERYLVSEVKKLIKDIKELWSKYDEQEKDLNQIKMSILYHILNETNAKKMPSNYRRILRQKI